MIHERNYRPTYVGRDNRDLAKLERLKKLTLLPLAITASLLWAKVLEPQVQSQSIHGLELPQQLNWHIGASSSIIPEAIILEHLSTQEYYDQAKLVFGCYRSGECKQLIEERLSKDTLAKSTLQYKQGNTTKEGRAFALSIEQDQDILRQYNDMIPHRGVDLLDAVQTTTYVANNSWYDGAVEGTGGVGGLDYVKTAREFAAQENTGDCDDTAVLNALLLSIRGIDSVMISYNSTSTVTGGFGHLLNGIEILDINAMARVVLEELVMTRGTAAFGLLRDLPILVIHSHGSTSYYTLLDATAIDTIQLREYSKTQVQYVVYNDKNRSVDKVLGSSPLISRLKSDISNSALVTNSELTLTSITQHGQYISTHEVSNPISSESIEIVQLGDLVPGLLNSANTK